MELLDEPSRALSWDAFSTFAQYTIAQSRRRDGSLSLLLLALDPYLDPSVQQDAALAATTLRVIANTIIRTIRSGDFTGRHGPCSFAVIAQDAQRAGSMRLAERFRLALPLEIGVFGSTEPFTVSIGIATLPQAGTSLAELLAAAERSLAESQAIGRGQITVSAGTIAGMPDPHGRTGLTLPREAAEGDRIDRLPVYRVETLALAKRAFERGESEGIAIKTQSGACPVCLDVARDVYLPATAPPLPVEFCEAPWGCRCVYGAAPFDFHRRPPPVSRARLETLEIPSKLRDASRFGADEKRGCKPEDLAAYLDLFPLLPISVSSALEPGEVPYLQRPAERAWEQGVRAGGVAAHGSMIPLTTPLAAWVKQASKPISYSADRLRDRTRGTVCLTSWRILFQPQGHGPQDEGKVETYFLADILGIEYLRDTLVLSLRDQRERLVLLVRDALQVGLCFARAVRNLSRPMA